MSDNINNEFHENEGVKFKQTLSLPLSRCDNNGKLSLPDCAAMFMDVATLDAERRGVGVSTIFKDGIIWLTVRARYRFYRMPVALENITLTTWPGSTTRAKCHRNYLMHSGKELCAEAFVDWLIYDIKSNSIAHELPQKFIEQSYLDETVCQGERAIINKNFSDGVLIGEIAVKSTDIDSAHHMNNIAYIRELFGLFSTSKLNNMSISELEISYLSPTLEGDTLRAFVRRKEGSSEFGLIKSDGTPAALINLIFTKKE